MEDISLQAKIDVLTEEQVLIQDSAVAFIARDPELKQVRASRFVQPGFDRALWREIADAGWLGFLVAEEEGGVGLGFADLALVLIQLGKGLVPVPFVATAVLAARTLTRADDAALRAELLPRLIGGDWLPALAWQEARASLDPAARNVVCANGRLHGRKWFVPDAGGADAFIVSAAEAGGTALYLVARDAPGLTLEFEQRVDGGFFAAVQFADTPWACGWWRRSGARRCSRRPSTRPASRPVPNCSA